MTESNELRQAELLADMGRHDEADRLFAGVLAREPDNEDALFGFARGLALRKRHDEATDVLERLLSVDPGHVDGLIQMSVSLCRLDRPREAVAVARRAVGLRPDSPACLVTLAEALREVTLASAEALTLAERAIELDPDNARAFEAVGKIHFDAERYSEAERAQREALRIEPGNWYAVMHLALAMAAMGRFGESREMVRTALRVNATPDGIDTALRRIEILGIPDQFAELYQMALTARGLPDLTRPGAAGADPELLAYQGRLAYRMTMAHGPGVLRRAGEIADAVLAADPGNPDARCVRVLALCDAGRDSEALPIANKLLAEGHKPARKAAMLARAGTHDIAGALEVCRMTLAENPDDLEYLRVQTNCLRALRKHDEALASARHLARLAPHGPDVQLGLGVAAKEAGEAALAEQALRAAMADQPRNVEPGVRLTMLLAEAGRCEEAEAVIASIPPDIPGADEVAEGCLVVAGVAITEAAPLLGKLHRRRRKAPADDVIANCEYWLGMALRNWTMAIDRGAGRIAARTDKELPKLVSQLRKLTVPPEAELATIVKGFGALLEDWTRSRATGDG
ncbi:MAG: tetratricopeptide repeat protein [Nocardiopsaceae bacterium]|nr:tetratricopeptide repeat protein [Nocardiopsaceae bacterium]